MSFRVSLFALCVMGGHLYGQTATSTGIVSVIPAAALAGQPVTITAQVSPAAQGSVLFLDGAEPVGVAPLNSSGVAQVTTIALGAGHHSLSAFYGGSANSLRSRSAAVSYTVSSNAGTGFAPAANYSIGTYPTAVTVEDFNGDGKADLAVTKVGSDNVSILLGNGDGTFHAPVNYPVGTEPRGIAAGDLNGDGKVDLVVASTYTGSISVLLGNGDGSFRAAATYGVPGSPIALTVADFNGDGKEDVAVAQMGSNQVGVLIGKGDGTFLPAVSYVVGTQPMSIAAADFNADGNPDLAVANVGGDVSILLGNGDGTFQAAVNTPVGSQAFFLATGDFNGDGKQDLAVVANCGTHSVCILPGKGDGTFQTAIPTLSSAISGLAVVDLNGDGKLDLAVTFWAENSLSVVLGNGDGTFQQPNTISTDVYPEFVAAGDFNRDGITDLAVAIYTAGEISILLGVSNTQPPALSITKSHTGDFIRGGGGSYNIVVGNGVTAGPTSGTVTVTDTPPAGLTIVLMSGNGWTCTGASCTRADSLRSGAVWPPIAVTVLVNAAAGSPLVNAAMVSGGGSSPATASDSTIIAHTPASLSVAAAHSGNFFQGQTGATYTITVSNAAGSASTTRIVTVAAGIPAGLTLVSIAGAGWVCDNSSANCSRSDPLAGGSTYPPITVTVNVAAGAPAQVASLILASERNSQAVSVTHTINIDPRGVPLRFVPVTPCRVADTRGPSGVFGGPRLEGGIRRDFSIAASACNIPSGVQAYSLNITAVPAGGLAYLSVWPSNLSQPLVSTLNAYDGRIVANAAIVPAGTDGAVSLYASDATNVILDINGYFVPASITSSLAFYLTIPCRVVDTRAGAGPFGAPFLAGGSTRNFTIPSSACGIPATAQVYSLNITVVPRGPLGYLTTWPTGQPLPLVSTLNSLDGSVVANAAIVPAGTGGAISMFVTDNTDVIIDVNGYFAPPENYGALSFYKLTPCRVADTRGAAGSFGGPLLPAAGTRSFPVPSSGCNVPGDALAYSFNVTAVPPGPMTYLTAWPAGESQPLVSTLNSLAGKVVANAAIVAAGASGALNLFASDPSHVILDINGYFAQ